MTKKNNYSVVKTFLVSKISHLLKPVSTGFRQRDLSRVLWRIIECVVREVDSQELHTEPEAVREKNKVSAWEYGQKKSIVLLYYWQIRDDHPLLQSV